jgi:hypothetical protein
MTKKMIAADLTTMKLPELPAKFAAVTGKMTSRGRRWTSSRRSRTRWRARGGVEEEAGQFPECRAEPR